MTRSLVISSATSQMPSRLWMKRARKEPLEREPTDLASARLLRQKP
jgi:hypothetical protein